MLEEAHKSFDIAVVSSANYAAVEEEWRRSGLLAHVDVLTTQQDGSKAHCIAELLKKGYAPQSAVMCGDARATRGRQPKTASSSIPFS